jgi:hypothetical protein
MVQHVQTKSCKPDCFGCKLLTIQFDPYQTRGNSGRVSAAPRGEPERWGTELAKDERGVNIIDAEGRPVTKKWAMENKHTIRTQREKRLALQNAAAQSV